MSVDTVRLVIGLDGLLLDEVGRLVVVTMIVVGLVGVINTRGMAP